MITALMIFLGFALIIFIELKRDRASEKLRRDWNAKLSPEDFAVLRKASYIEIDYFLYWRKNNKCFWIKLL